MRSRREVLWGVGSLCWMSTITPLAAAAASGPAVADPVWRGWVVAWREMQTRVTERGWEFVRLDIDGPASEGEIRRVETQHGVTIPVQLREVLSQRSARVRFGWSIPPLLRPLEGMDLPTSGGLRDVVWSLEHIDKEAIVSFNRLRDRIARLDNGEEANSPEMWENQFPFAAVGEGDFLTIDMSRPDGPQPVRYFSSAREGLHHHIIAPDFVSFISAYARLGCAGRDHDDWFRFIDADEGELRYLDPDGEGGRRWLKWLARDPHRRDPDEPPEPVPAKTRADFNLLDAAEAGSGLGIEAALAAGATPDCVDGNQPDRRGHFGGITFETALIHVVRRGDLGSAARLLTAGAPIDTRLLSVSEAVRTGTVETVRWLLSRGARVNGWNGERHAPLHALLVQGGDRRSRNKANTLAMLEMLLKAGADPNARFDGGRSLLSWCSADVIKLLLEHGADANAFDRLGNAPLHVVRSVETVRLLAAHAAEPNAMTRPPVRGAAKWIAPHTPYQAQLQVEPYQIQMQRLTADASDSTAALLDALVAAGADAKRRDGWSRNTLWYCRSVADAIRHIELGLDPTERGAGGETLLHGIVNAYRTSFGRMASAVALFTYYQAIGLDINAPDRDGSTVLHLAAIWSNKTDIAWLLSLGADKTATDKRGRRPVDRVLPRNQEVRELLRV
jgi:ankyrin repeat protein